MDEKKTLHLENVYHSYPQPDGKQVCVVDIEKLTIQSESTFGIRGASGAGKSTLLYTLSGIETPQKGTISWGDKVINKMNESERDRWRRGNVGFVFQDFYLYHGLNVLQNVMLPSTFDSKKDPSVKEHALSLLEKVDVNMPLNKVETLSRGEMQRVAIARALLFSPSIIFADEPTASLDVKTGKMITGLILDLAKDYKSTLIVVSHDEKCLEKLDTVITMEHGKIIDTERRSS